MAEQQLTATEYDPDDELKRLLTEFIAETTLSVENDQTLTIKGSEAQQKDFIVNYRDFELSGTETYGICVMASYEGHLGLASCLVLSHALNLGVPTHAHLDESTAPEPLFQDPYQDLTAEWYPPAAVKMGLPEERLKQRTGFEHELIGLDKIEEYARVWLSAGTNE